MNAKKPTEPEDFPRAAGRVIAAALREAGYNKLEDLNGVSMSHLKKLHGVGPKGLKILQEHLQARGLSMAE